jgi:Protein of unknown function DUF262
MRLLPSDPDVETIVGRIKTGDIDLQPGFQRGEVWSKLKKQRLIDSILRDWHVPPIHVIEDAQTRKQEILDGQQRLVAIRDFVEGRFPVASSVEPYDEGLESIGGMFYEQLAPEWHRRFNQFTIRVFRIVDFRPSEPGELFFRLNQPTSLTGAEQRNAFFGPVREQIKNLVDDFSKSGIEKEVFGFSNSRMAYDDVLSRVALSIERNDLSIKITSGNLADLYRQEAGLSETSVEVIRQVVYLFASARLKVFLHQKPNKATVFSWLIFLVRSQLNGYTITEAGLSNFLLFFQERRNDIFNKAEIEPHTVSTYGSLFFAYAVYDSRSVARVADVSSVILRDAVIWMIHDHFVLNTGLTSIPSSIPITLLRSAFSPSRLVGSEDDSLARHLLESGWGKLW